MFGTQAQSGGVVETEVGGVVIQGTIGLRLNYRDTPCSCIALEPICDYHAICTSVVDSSHLPLSIHLTMVHTLGLR